jgi:general secretion pathway protein G
VIGSAARRRQAGFTLLELMTVIIVMGVLVAIALPNYRAAIIQAKEAVLREDLYRFRDLIDQYYADKGKYPASLDTLVEDGYLRKLPVDPMTGGPDWEATAAEADPENPGEEPGVYDVHSSSELVSMSGTPYKEW